MRDRAGGAHRQGRRQAAARRLQSRSSSWMWPTGNGSRDCRLPRCTGCLGSRPDTSSRFRHHRGNRLPHDVIVVDETSMVSLTMMARLLEAVRPQARLVLVGDPDQLASVEAGAVFGRPGRRARGARRSAGGGSEDLASVRRIDRRAGDRRSAAATQTGSSSCCGPATSTSSGSTTDEPTDRLRDVLCPTCASATTGCRGRRRGGGAGDARRASAALRAPARAVRRRALEPSGRALADRGDRRADLVSRGTPDVLCW